MPPVMSRDGVHVLNDEVRRRAARAYSTARGDADFIGFAVAAPAVSRQIGVVRSAEDMEDCVVMYPRRRSDDGAGGGGRL